MACGDPPFVGPPLPPLFGFFFKAVFFSLFPLFLPSKSPMEPCLVFPPPFSRFNPQINPAALFRSLQKIPIFGKAICPKKNLSRGGNSPIGRGGGVVNQANNLFGGGPPWGNLLQKNNAMCFSNQVPNKNPFPGHPPF